MPEAIKKYLVQKREGITKRAPEPSKKYPATPRGFLMPKAHMKEKVTEVEPEMMNVVTGENLISFGTGG